MSEAFAATSLSGGAVAARLLQALGIPVEHLAPNPLHLAALPEIAPLPPANINARSVLVVANNSLDTIYALAINPPRSLACTHNLLLEAFMSPARLVRALFAVFSVVLFTFVSSSAAPLQTPSSQTQGVAYLQKALAALAPSTTIIDVTLTGTARRIAGSDDESGNVVLKALPTGESRMDLTFPSNVRSEIRANSSTGPVGAWSGSDGTLHLISQHNLWTDSSWYFPAFTLARLLGDSSYSISDFGAETRYGQSVEHLAVFRQSTAKGAPPGWVSSVPVLSKTDIYLDSSTLLPAAIVFNTHPDKNQTINIPVEIRLSNYHQANGVLAPLHIQHYLNNGLALDLELTALTPNSGLPASTFAVGAAQ